MENLDLATVWAFILAFAVFAYVVLDGFDLGIGILFPMFDTGTERDSPSPYDWLMPMHPSPSAETSSPWPPSLRVGIVMACLRRYAGSRRS